MSGPTIPAPVEPTETMLEAGYKAAIRSANTRASSNPARYAADIWSAMIAAVPTQPTTPVERTEQPVVEDGESPWTVWDDEARMAGEGDWRGVAYSISHDILPLIPEGSSDHAYQERARMQIKAADRLCAAILALTKSPSTPLTPASSPDSTVAGVDGLRKALIEQEAIDLVVDLCGPGASQSGTNCRVVEDHLKQFARNFAALTASSTSGLADGGGDDKRVEVVARLLIEQRGVNPDSLYQHHEWEDFPIDERRDYADPFTGEPRSCLMHRAWKKRIPDAKQILAALAQPDAITSGMPDRPSAAPSEVELPVDMPEAARIVIEHYTGYPQGLWDDLRAALQPTPSTDSYTGAGE